jgi:hypothetical protein
MHYVLTRRAAEEEAAALRPHVPHVRLRFSRRPPAGSFVTLGTARAPAAALDTEIPVDPGVLRVRVDGPFVHTRSLERRISPGEHATLDIEVVPAHAGSLSPLRVTGIVGGIAGLALAGSGLGLWLVADGQFHQLQTMRCGMMISCIAQADAGERMETASIAMMASGGALALAGAVLAIASNRAHERDDESRAPIANLSHGGIAF